MGTIITNGIEPPEGIMSRLVQPAPPKALAATTPNPDPYSSRVAKYIPGEVLSGYVSMSGIVATMNPEEQLATWTAWGILALGAILTPAYIVYLAGGKPPYRLQAAISTIAFLLWAYTLGGPFKSAGLYNAQIGAILLIAFTLIAGLFQPRAAV